MLTMKAFQRAMAWEISYRDGLPLWIEENMHTSEEMNAVIKSVSITNEDSGALTAWLNLEYDVGGQGFGGHALYLPETFDHHNVKSFAGHFIAKCMEVGGVSKWDRLTGKSIRVRIKNGMVHAIGHIIKDVWFCPSDAFKPHLERKLPEPANDNDKPFGGTIENWHDQFGSIIGTLVNDELGRFAEGTTITTSSYVNLDEEKGELETRNTRYKLGKKQVPASLGGSK